MASCLEEREPSLSFVEGDKLELTYGESKKLHLNYTPHDAVLGTVRWRESNGSVAWADNFGKVYAWGVGESVITAETEIEGVQVTATCLVTVREEKMTSLKLDTTECILTFGQKVKLAATYEPSNPSFPELSWSSSDENIATVNGNGEVSAKNEEGECVITVTNRDSSLTAQCHLYVIPVEMTSLQLSETHRDLEIGKQFKLTASYEPSDVTYKDLHWSSSDESVATVSNGLVMAVGLGDCVITVSNRDGSMTAECEVSVYSVEMTSLVLSETKCEIALGESHELKATYEPEYVTLPKLTWSSSDAKVAKVVDGKIEPIGVGTCVISVTNHNESLTAQCEVIVYIKEIAAISCLSEKTLEQGEHFVLSATYEPSFVSPGCDILYWESSDESVATVNKETGEVTCVGVGECTITVGNTYNDVTATCRLTVLPISVKSISLNKTSLQAIIGKAYKLSYTINPDNAANKEVKWESSDNSIATVAEDGTMTPISKGKATIKVTAQDGSNSFSECVVEVMDAKSYVENYISIRQTGLSGIVINGVAQPGSTWSFKATNNGDETVYLKEVRGYGSMRGSISIDKELTPGLSYDGGFKTNKLDWVFEINGVECVKRY